jgi:threonine synthase
MFPNLKEEEPMFYSSRNQKLSLTASEALLKGISEDGGLFLPEHIATISPSSLLGKSYPELAYAILQPYFDDFSSDELRHAIDQAYSSSSFPEKIYGLKTFGRHSFLELFHGQTLTFKDMALSLLPFLMEIALEKHPEERGLRILTATSGDTGSAVLSSFKRSSSIGVSVLYPEGGIAPFQEKQMLSFTSSRGRAYALKNSNFDDAQTLVKKILVHPEAGEKFSSANSINIGRLLPQIVYYYAAYLSLVEEKTIQMGETLDVVVPTGNFGDIFAAYLAKKMSLPLGQLVVASNANSVLTDFFHSCLYDARRAFYKTNSPSMDILVSSNLERLLSLTCQSDEQVRSWENQLAQEGHFQVDEVTLKKLQADFSAYSASEEDTKKAIRDCYQKESYLLDPHTAVGYAAYLSYQEHSIHETLIVATASPLKFPKTVMSALGYPEGDDFAALEKMKGICKVILPPQFEKALLAPSEKYAVDPTKFESLLSPRLSYEVKAPATSANLGCGFDVCGIALSSFNVFRFAPASSDQILNFHGLEETQDNLVLRSYRYFFEHFNLPYQNVAITLIQEGIPLSRGLGSSASCIVAGLLAANEISGRYVKKEALLPLANAIEGHPDNVAPCLLGGFVATLKKEDGTLWPLAYPVSSEMGFLLAIPEQELSTVLARGILPKSYPLKDITYDASRLVHLPAAFARGDLPLLEEIFHDRLHVPYRLALISEAEKIQNIAGKYHLPFTISGAGSSLLILYSRSDLASLHAFEEEARSSLSGVWTFQDLTYVKEGAEIMEVSSHE